MSFLTFALIVAPLFIIAMILFFVFLYRASWNIPVVVFRFLGNKGRPMILIKKAKKRIINGVPKLFVKGYKLPIRDFRQEYYYPTVRGAKGGLILWEYEDEKLTPAILYNKNEKFTKEQLAAIRAVQEMKTVDFEFDPDLFRNLKLKAVDDVDVEFMLQELSRVDRQYQGGWRDFLVQHGHILGWLILGVIILVIVVLGLKAAPDIFAQCANAATEVAKSNLLEKAAAAAAPAG